jgi:glutathione S-transferase
MTFSTLQISSDYGYVILAASATAFLNIFQIVNIAKLRKKHGINYPAMTSDKHDDFNCAQRVHANTLENIPFFLSTLMMAGIRSPLLAAGFGGLWIFGRFLYSVGYYSHPKKRMPGFIISQFCAGLPLLLLSFYTGTGLVGWF